MTMKLNQYLPSSDGSSDLHVVHWVPRQDAIACLMISHGMMEMIDRYDEFACYLADHQIAVIGHDHLGHGGSCTPENRGYFGEGGGIHYLLQDIDNLCSYGRKQYGHVPLFILGHSMGSFLVRRYLTLHKDRVSGALLLGTGDQSLLSIRAAQILTCLLTLLKGPRYQSQLLHQLTVGNFNRYFSPVLTPSDWLSRDEQQVRAYVQHRDTQFLFTCSAYGALFGLLAELKQPRHTRCIPSDLPVFLLSGSRDPVGDMGKAAVRVAKQLKKAGVRRVKLKVYPGARHELLNETNRTEVYQDILTWLMHRIQEEKQE